MRSTKLIITIIAPLIILVAIGIFLVNRNWYLTNVVETLGRTELNAIIRSTVAVVIGMIPSGMLLLTSLALTVGILRLMSQNTLVQDLYSLEMLARVNVLCLDKTGTITDGRMKVNDCMLLNNPTNFTINEILGSCLSALHDNNQTSIALNNYFGHSSALKPSATIPFSSKRKLSAVTFDEIGTVAMGAPEFVLGTVPDKIDRIINQYASSGLRVLIVALSSGKIVGDKLPSAFKPLAIISIADNIREDAAQTIRWFKENDVAVKIISGDNPVTVSEVARRVGVANADKYISLEGLNEKEVASVANQYTVFGRVTPEQKAILVKAIKSEGNTVAMTGDGVNDILALKEADCAVSVASGSDAAKNVSHIVLLDNNFASMPKVVYEGRRVINNIQNSSSMYLMKTLFTTIFAIISIILGQRYPFETNNLMLMEIFVIGVPTFFLSLQPNTNRVQGKFLPTVLSRAVPFALVLVLAAQSTQFIAYLQPEYFQAHTKEISVVIITFSGLAMLYRVCLPGRPVHRPAGGVPEGEAPPGAPPVVRRVPGGRRGRDHPDLLPPGLSTPGRVAGLFRVRRGSGRSAGMPMALPFQEKSIETRKRNETALTRHVSFLFLCFAFLSSACSPRPVYTWPFHTRARISFSTSSASVWLYP